MADTQPSQDWCGMTVSFSLKADPSNPITAEVFTFDPESKTLVLIENKVGAHIASYRYVRVPAMDLSTVRLSGSANPPEPMPPLTPQIMKRIRDKEREAVDKERLRCNETIGSGIAHEIQVLFNGLAKTMQCKWKDKDIVVDYERGDGGVRISPPYTSDKVQGGHAELVTYVKKVLEGERVKLRI
uniref:AD domain-containing protein n=1 Tax=Hemiselmis andersenii TaxID=464988 RepID=A0A6U2FQY4_HEMAN|mmetsp:Transcript_33276/g.77877  ORF Transcript_33276/g.77877 Transcript_33276/m.77877 type:complete len:185 (+) Transcript_33276:81-635(+)